LCCNADLPPPEVTVHSPLIAAGWTVAVLLGLYGFYCHWEANRVELAAAFQRRTARTLSSPDAPRYRTRCRLSLLASVLAAAALVTGL
jgi:hypothetical protein